MCTSTAAEASTNPANRPPQRPGTIRAGGQPCIRNPVSAAASTLSSVASPSMTSAAAHPLRAKAVTTATVPITPSA